MALDQNDLQILKQMFDDQSRDLRDFARQENAALENRLTKKIDALDQKLTSTEARIIDGISESLDLAVHPRIEDHEARIMKLEEKAGAVHTS